MKLVSTYTLAFALAASATAIAWTSPAEAQSYGTPPPPPPPSIQRSDNRGSTSSQENNPDEYGIVEFNPGALSDPVRAIVVAAQTILEAEEGGPVDTAAIQTQLESAVPLIANEDDRFIVGSVMLQNAAKIQTQGGSPEQIQPVQLQGIRLALDSNRVTLDRRAIYWTALGNAANSSNDSATALNAYQNVLRYDPNNADAHIQSALAHFRDSNTAAGYDSSLQAFTIMRAAGQSVPPSWHNVPFGNAYRANDVPRVVQFGRELLISNPSPQNWNEVLRVYQTIGRLDDQANLDLLRLMRASNGLDPASINEYVTLASRRGLPREAQRIYTGTVAGGAIPANQEMASELASSVAADQSGLAESEASARSAANGRVALNTADAYASYGENAKALELYQIALDKGGVDAGVVNLRRGALLNAMGQSAEARAAFEAVSGGRAPLAAFWLQWLDEQAGASAPTAPAEPASAE